MGLDMMLATRLEDENAEDGEFIEKLYQWRKHPNLHGLMEQIFREKNIGNTEDFNCIRLYLDKQDILKIINRIENNKLPDTSGFFFGTSFNTIREKEEDLEAFRLALEALKDDRITVFYDSWW